MSENKKDDNQPAVINLGCRLNGYESNVIEGLLKANKLDADCIVINTCAVTKEAERQSRQMIRKIKKQHSDKKIIVTGCAAQINPEQFINMPEVAKVIGNGFKDDNQTYKNIAQEWSSPLQISTPKAIINDIMSIKETAHHMLPDTQSRSRAFLQIQNGCNHRCTFCIIPYGRGNSRSVPVAQVINSINSLVESGYNEVVLTGVDITDYGLDLPGSPKLGNLCKRILNSTSLPRLRLSSVDVAEIDNDIMDLVTSDARFMPYFHISLQSGDDLILKRMKRRHNRQQVIDFCKEVRKLRPNCGFGADIICGFPTESEIMFQNTVELVKEAQIHYIHAFTYSARTGTPAARMPQVPLATRKARTAELISIGKENLSNFLIQMINTDQKIVLEEAMQGKTENFATVKIINPDEISSISIGSIVNIRIKSSQNGTLLGEAINPLCGSK